MLPRKTRDVKIGSITLRRQPPDRRPVDGRHAHAGHRGDHPAGGAARGGRRRRHPHRRRHRRRTSRRSPRSARGRRRTSSSTCRRTTASPSRSRRSSRRSATTPATSTTTSARSRSREGPLPRRRRARARLRHARRRQLRLRRSGEALRSIARRRLDHADARDRRSSTARCSTTSASPLLRLAEGLRSEQGHRRQPPLRRGAARTCRCTSA